MIIKFFPQKRNDFKLYSLKEFVDKNRKQEFCNLILFYSIRLANKYLVQHRRLFTV